MIWKKDQVRVISEGTTHFRLPLALMFSGYLGLVFYDLWLPSPQLQAMAERLRLPADGLLGFVAAGLSLLSLFLVCAILRRITEGLSRVPLRVGPATELVVCLGTAAITVALAQLEVYCKPFSMGYEKFLLGMLLVAAAILFLYVFIGKMLPSVFFAAGFFMVIATANTYTFRFRKRPFEPTDLYSLGTAMDVAESYSLFPIPIRLIFSWGVFSAVLLVLYGLDHFVKTTSSKKARGFLLPVCIIVIAAVIAYSSRLKPYHWVNQGASFHGYFLDFTSKLKELRVAKPDSYRVGEVDALAHDYAPDEGVAENESSPPHIIVIMDESFSDLGVLGDFSTDTEVTPFISSLKENTVSGYALVSVHGGNTANSEYEFLTGNSMAWLSPSSVPYQQYLRSPSYSMVSWLKLRCNYKCIAMHPYLPNGWNRPNAYRYLGFDECHFMEDFPQEKYVRDRISDQEMFEYLADLYEKEKSRPLFLFGVTMQNHGSYNYRGGFTNTVSLSDNIGRFPDVELYLSLIHETDKAVEWLIRYFQNVEEDVVIVFFGDHQPSISDAFFEAVSASSAFSLDERQKLYKVPFFIWSNYDREDEWIDCVSLNYLSSYVYEAAGLALPPYNRFLRELEQTIPAINANGFYSLAERRFLSLDEANAEERLWLDRYEALQYNNIVDKAHRNDALFPVIE